MNKHSIVNLKCPCFLFRYPNFDIPRQALFNLHRASALPLGCCSEDNQNLRSPPGHSRRPIRRRRYCMVLVWHSARHVRPCGEVQIWRRDSRVHCTVLCKRRECSGVGFIICTLFRSLSSRQYAWFFLYFLFSSEIEANHPLPIEQWFRLSFVFLSG